MKIQLTLALAILLLSLGVPLVSGLEKPEINDITADVTPDTINTYSYYDWTPEELAHIDPENLKYMDTRHARQYFRDRIPFKGYSNPVFYKPTFAAETVLYANLHNLYASFKDLSGAQLGHRMVKFPAELDKQGGNKFGDRIINFIEEKGEVIIRQTPEGLKVEGIQFNKGTVLAVKNALLFYKGSSFKGNGFTVIDSATEIQVKEGCGSSSAMCIREFDQFTEEKTEKMLILEPSDSKEKQPNQDIIIEDGKYDSITVNLRARTASYSPITMQIRKEDGSLTPIFFQGSNIWMAPGEVPLFKSEIVIREIDLTAVVEGKDGKSASASTDYIQEIFSLSNGELRWKGVIVNH